MNYSKITNICKKTKHLTLYTVSGTQWISDVYAVYPLLNMPIFTETSIRVAYDIPESVKVMELTVMPPHICFADIDPTENMVFFEKIQLKPCGRDTVALRTQTGTTFIEKRYLDPISDFETNGQVCLYERLNKETGEVYIAVKRGMRLEAVILPLSGVLSQDWVSDLEELVRVIKHTLSEEVRRQHEQ